MDWIYDDFKNFKRRLVLVVVLLVLCIRPVYCAEETTAETPQHFIGLGYVRTKELVTYPALHPAKFVIKCTFPLRHPLVAFRRMGKEFEPYQPGLSAMSALSQMATPFLVGFTKK